MRPAAFLLPLLVVASAVGLPGCLRQAPPPPPAPAKPVTGWSAEVNVWAVSQLSEALVADAWAGRFHEVNGRAPVIEVTPFADRSGDHVPVDDLATALARALAGSDRVLTASPGQVADVRLVGAVGLRDGQDGGQPARFFTVDARVEDLHADGAPLWVTGMQTLRPAVVAAPAPAGPARDAKAP